MIRSTLETFLEVSIVNLIKLYALDFSTWFEVIGSTFTLASLTAFVLFIILTPVCLTVKCKDLTDDDFVSKYGSLVQDMKPS